MIVYAAHASCPASPFAIRSEPMRCKHFPIAILPNMTHLPMHRLICRCACHQCLTGQVQLMTNCCHARYASWLISDTRQTSAGQPTTCIMCFLSCTHGIHELNAFPKCVHTRIDNLSIQYKVVRDTVTQPCPCGHGKPYLCNGIYATLSAQLLHSTWSFRFAAFSAALPNVMRKPFFTST